MAEAAKLYDEDFYAWTRAQAEALRRLAGEHWNGPLDLEHLAEEVEDLGKSQRHAVESLIERIIEHLLKLEYSSRAASVGAHAGVLTAAIRRMAASGTHADALAHARSVPAACCPRLPDPSIRSSTTVGSPNQVWSTVTPDAPFPRRTTAYLSGSRSGASWVIGSPWSAPRAMSATRCCRFSTSGSFRSTR